MRSKERVAKRLTTRERIAIALAGCGAWKDRADWKGRSSASIAAEMRKRGARRIRER